MLKLAATKVGFQPFFFIFPPTWKDETMIFYPIGSISVIKYFKCL